MLHRGILERRRIDGAWISGSPTTSARYGRTRLRSAAGLRPMLEADPEWWRQGMLSDGDSLAANRALGDAGWIGLSWPPELGGRGLTRLDATLAEEMFGYHWLPLSSYLLSYKTIGAALERFAPRPLVERLLPPIARGELVFCQGFSEPGAGSDLGALTTRAELRGDRFVVSGHKIWTSSAHLADWVYLAVRTDAEPSKHRGISVLVAPVDTPGIEVRRFGTLGGGYLCEMFLDGVEIPADQLVGELNGGWQVLMYTLDFERDHGREARRRGVGARRGGGAAAGDRAPRCAAARAAGPAARRAAGGAADLLPCGGRARPRRAGERDLGHGEALGLPRRAARGRRRDRPARPRGARRREPGRRDRRARGRSVPRIGGIEHRGRDFRRAAARDRPQGSRPVSLPLEGVRVVEYAQYVAGPLCGLLLAELGADVVKVEPPGRRRLSRT